MKTIYSVLFIICTIASLFAWKHANAALYCYPQGMNTVCISDDGRSVVNERSRESISNPNLLILTPPMLPYPYYPRPYPRAVPEQDFGECTLALGCIKDRR